MNQCSFLDTCSVALSFFPILFVCFECYLSVCIQSASALSGCLSVCTVRLSVSLHCQVVCQSVLSASALSGYLSVCTVCVCTVRLSVSLYCLRLHCQVVCQSERSFFSVFSAGPSSREGGMTRPKQLAGISSQMIRRGA